MKIPLRKLKSLVQYCLLGGAVLGMVYTVSILAEQATANKIDC